VSAAWFFFRLARTLRWPVASVVLEPFGRPLVAVAAGVAAGLALSSMLPPLAGAAAWPLVVAVGAVASLATVGVTVVTGLLPWREALKLMRPGTA
jgi:hypothetical protein